MSCFNQCAECKHRILDNNCAYWERSIDYQTDTSDCEGFEEA